MSGRPFAPRSSAGDVWARIGGGSLMSQAGIAYGEDTLIARWARAWSTQDASLFLSLFADDAHYYDVALDKAFRGREAIRAFFEGTFVTFPDFKMEIERCAVTGEAAVGEWVMSGTFLGESFGVPPTGKSFRVQGAVTCACATGGSSNTGITGIRRRSTNRSKSDRGQFRSRFGASPRSPNAHNDRLSVLTS